MDESKVRMWKELERECREAGLADSEMTIAVLDAALKAKDEVHKEDMAATQEQLAEIREAAERVLIDQWIVKGSPLAQLEQALSAAPKRGRVIRRKKFLIKGTGMLKVATIRTPDGPEHVYGRGGKTVEVIVRKAE